MTKEWSMKADSSVHGGKVSTLLSYMYSIDYG
jgi:hypothetical protein